MRVLLVLGILLAACWAGLPWQPLSASGDQPDKAQVSVDELIRRLGSPQFKEREEATRLLLERKDAIPALRKIVATPGHPELVRRARLLLEQLAQRRQQRMLDRFRALVKAGAVDQCAELLARWPMGWEERGCWQITCNLQRTLFQLNKKRRTDGDSKSLFDLVPTPLVVTGTRITKLPDPEEETLLFVRGGEVQISKPGSFNLGVVASSGPVRLPIPAVAIFAADSVRVEQVGPLIVSDGEVTSWDGAWHSVIIARGDVTLRGGAKASLILAGGSVRAEGVLKDCLVVSGKSVLSAMPRRKDAYINCTIKENEPSPFGFVRFFDLVREGIVVESADRGVRVKIAGVGKPFAQAGLRAGDMITAVDGEPGLSPEVFRRLLRRGWVAEEGVALRVLRGGHTLEIWVPAPQ